MLTFTFIMIIYKAFGMKLQQTICINLLMENYNQSDG